MFFSVIQSNLFQILTLMLREDAESLTASNRTRKFDVEGNLININCHLDYIIYLDKR